MSRFSELFILFASLPVLAVSLPYDLHEDVCQPIRVSACADSPYNLTRMPNMLQHLDQDQAQAAIKEFEPLLEIKCSHNAKFFLCSIFTPLCSETINYPIVACRSVCNEVREHCGPLLAQYRIPWPEMLNCSLFPEEKQDLCMKPDQRTQAPESSVRSSVDDYRHEYLFPTRTKPKQPDSQFTCEQNFVQLDFGTEKRACAPACRREIRFTAEHKEFAQLWMQIWASACFAISTFAVASFFLDTSRFQYPERPIVYLCVCFSLYSLGYVVRLILGASAVSCTQHHRTKCFYIVQGGLESAQCVIVFLLLYYFSMASAIWWVILTYSWYLSACRSWCAESIVKKANLFYLIGWGLPAVQSIAVLVLKQFDGDELTGLCFVGNSDPVALIGFVLAPFSLYTLLGSAFILAGFVGVFKVRKTIQKGSPLDNQPPSSSSQSAAHDHNRVARDNVQRLERLMIRIGIFSVMYLAAALCLIACHIYESIQLYKWADFQEECPLNGPTPTSECVEVYMLKIFMSLAVGITSGSWMLSFKTGQTWRRFFSRPKQKPQPASTPPHVVAGGQVSMPQNMIPLLNAYGPPPVSLHSQPPTTSSDRRVDPCRMVTTPLYSSHQYLGNNNHYRYHGAQSHNV